MNDALSRGACAVMAEQRVPQDVPQLTVPDARPTVVAVAHDASANGLNLTLVVDPEHSLSLVRKLHQLLIAAQDGLSEPRRIDIGEHGCCAADYDAADGGYEAARCDDDLVAGPDAQRAQSEFQPDAAIGQCNAMLDAHVRCIFALERSPLFAGPVVGTP